MTFSSIKKKYLGLVSFEKLMLSKNISISFLSKGFSLAVNFAMIPLLLSFLGNELYGIWLTIFSIISWMTFFDLGLGNGLRNHLTNVFVRGDTEKAKDYISTAYWLLGAFTVICIAILQIFIFFVNWSAVFRPTGSINESFNIIVSICLWGFGALIVTRLISSILQSKKQVGKSDALIATGTFFCLVIIYIISKFEIESKLYYVAFVFSWIPPIIYLVYSYIFFRKNKTLIPSKRPVVKKKLINNIFGLGIQFFVVQFLVLVLNQSANIIITQVLSPSQVTVYYLPLRLFSIITILMGLISNNLLPYFTEAYAKNNFEKMRKIFQKFFKVLGLMIGLFFIVLLFGKPIIKLWTSDLVKVPFSLLFLHFLLAIIVSANGIFSSFLNGIGKLKKLILILASSATIFIFLSIYLGQKMGLNGIVLALILVQTPILLVLATQTVIILKKGLNQQQ